MFSRIRNLSKLKIPKRPLIILDGGTGTEIEKRLSNLPNLIKNDAWVAATHLYHPEIVLDVHKSYKKAGADIITANTYATNRHVLKAAGLENELEKAIVLAVELAREAATSKLMRHDIKAIAFHEAKVAGSISCHPPAVKLINGAYIGNWPSKEQEFQNYKEATELLIDQKVDYLFIELMKDLEHSPVLMEAVAEVFKERKCDIPIHLGISTRLNSTYGAGRTKVCLFDRSQNIPFTPDLIENFIKIFQNTNENSNQHHCNLQSINLMHTNFSIIEHALKILKSSSWQGKIGCYPDHGHYKVPEWVFEELEMEEALKYARKWEEMGVSMIGGCCGVGPEFIEAVAREFGEK